MEFDTCPSNDSRTSQDDTSESEGVYGLIFEHLSSLHTDGTELSAVMMKNAKMHFVMQLLEAF